VHANPQSVADVFKMSCQYVIPVFQRHYVWDRETQWEPLWEDLVSQARVRLHGGTPKPHYCGAIVIDQKKQQAINELPRFHVIDGQQRLTTFQVILAALRDVCQVNDLADSLQRLIGFLVNQNFKELSDPEAEQFKLRPTRYDKESFEDVITFGGREKLSQKYVESKGKRGKDIPKIVAAYLYFFDQLLRSISHQDEVFGSETHTAGEVLQALLDAFTADFSAVVIILENSDDAQIIYESLSSRGTPLLASDLMRNYIFLRAEQNVTALFEKYWVRFEDRFWTQEEKQGRLKKPRLEFLMTNILSAKTASEILHTKVYQEYLAWIGYHRHALTVEKELQDFVALAQVYRTLVQGDEKTPLGGFARFLHVFDMTTIFPLILAVCTEGPSDDDARGQILADLESYLMRRLICQRTTKNYNRFFLSAIKELRSKKFAASEFREFLLQQTSETSDWPSDQDLKEKWLLMPAYAELPSARLNYILRRIEQAQTSKFTEDITINSALTVEHVMPRNWFTTWLLSDGSLVSEQFATEARQKHVLGMPLLYDPWRRKA
jgi:uncharacterized protein with ParB-like and HNH nuclease domain